jgi:hypothetical protein
MWHVITAARTLPLPAATLRRGWARPPPPPGREMGHVVHNPAHRRHSPARRPYRYRCDDKGKSRTEGRAPLGSVQLCSEHRS